MSLTKMEFKTNKMINIFKSGIFLSLFVVFYVFYFSEVAKKYANRNTYLSETNERVERIEPPVLTLCLAGPKAKQSVLKKYNISVKALNEPSLMEKMILKTLNKTVEEFFREATFELNRDFKLSISYESYDEDGAKDHKVKLNLGYNSLQVTHFENFL